MKKSLISSILFSSKIATNPSQISPFVTFKRKQVRHSQQEVWDQKSSSLWPFGNRTSNFNFLIIFQSFSLNPQDFPSLVFCPRKEVNIFFNLIAITDSQKEKNLLPYCGRIFFVDLLCDHERSKGEADEMFLLLWA